MQTILDKFTHHFKHVIYQAFRIAQSTPEKIITPEHLLWGLLQEKGSLASELLKKLNLKLHLQSPIHYPLDQAPPNFESANLFPLSGQAQRVIERAVLTAAHFEHPYIGTEHLLYSLMESTDQRLKSIFKTQRISPEKLSLQVESILTSTTRFPELAESLNLTTSIETASLDESEGAGEASAPSPDGIPQATQTKTKEPRTQKRKSKTPALDFFATNLTSESAQATIDPVVGRVREINRVIQILGRRTKNNPVLLGEPGVGKTAIVEGLAKKIFSGNVPELLVRKKIYSLDLSLLIAGTIYRGEFESRLKQVLDEIKSDPDIILFIDEIHTIIGAGASGSGALDAANMLKPALARGYIRCIGATTFGEYKKYIESDPALERRFQAVNVPEVSPDEAVQILQGIKRSYERHHRVHIGTDAIEAAVALSVRYQPSKFLPDKAIDLIDEAASRKKLRAPVSASASDLQKLQRELEGLRSQKQRAVLEENFPHALALKEQELRLETLLAENAGEKPPIDWIGTIHPQDIAEVISEMTGIPLPQLARSSHNKPSVMRLERQLGKLIIGQDGAIHELAATIKRAHAGLSGHTRPLGSFMFLGPSGVGKTETAKALSELVYGRRDALVRFDMSEFAESFNISKLIGAPAGYVGYQEGGKLTEIVRRQPYSLILFDEIEKAHPDVSTILLQVLEDGHLTDASGKRIDFKNTLIIMTSNIGLERFNQSAALGFESNDTENASQNFETVKQQVLEEVKTAFRPEFVNRVDKIIVFEPLKQAAVARIAELQLASLRARLAAEHHMALTWDAHAVKHIAAKSFSPDQGARGIRKYILDFVETPLADIILKGGKSVTTIALSLKGDMIQLLSS